MIILEKIPYYRLCGLTEWRMLKVHPRYSVSCNGEVVCWNWCRTGKPRLCKLTADGQGYLMVGIDGVLKKVHRLVAEAFIPNPEGKKDVDHIDTNRQNNCVCNLRWATRKENCNNPLSVKHYSENAHKPMLGKFGADNHSSISIVQLSLDGRFIKQWAAAAEVEREIGIFHQSIAKCCKGKYKSAGGYRWVYDSEFQNSSENVIKTKRISDIQPLF